MRKIDEQYLAHELSQMKETIQQSRQSSLTPEEARTRAHKPFNPVISSKSPEFKDAKIKDSFSSYESLKPTAKYQDLTHEETRRVQELRHRKLMLERRATWLKVNQMPDPEKEARKLEKENRKAKDEEQLYPPPYESKDTKKIARLEQEAKVQTIEAKLRARIRKEKQASSAIVNAHVPTISGQTLDPIKRQIAMRKVRIQTLIQQNVDECLSHNTSQILGQMLDGASVSVVKIEAENFRKTQNVHVTVTSDHDPEWVINRLNMIAPKLRSQLALRLNLGHTPELKFLLSADPKKFDKKRLLRMARFKSRKIAVDLQKNFSREMNW